MQKIEADRRIVSVPLAEHRNILYAVDGLLVLVALLVGLWLGSRQSNWQFSLRLILEYSPWFVGVTLGYFVLASANDAYRPRVASDPVASLVAIAKTVLQIFVVYLLIYALLPPWSLPRHFVGYFTLISPVLLVMWRRVYSKVFVLAFKRKAIVVGAGWSGQTIAKTFQDFAAGHFELSGFVDDDPAKLHQTFHHAQVLGTTADLPQLAKKRQITDVVMAISRDVSGQVLASLMQCNERGVQISTMTDLYEHLTDRVPVEHVGDNWFVVLPFSTNSHRLTYRLFKRGVDIALSLLGLLLFALIFPFLALALYLDSPGDIFYRQRRVGRGGQVFELVKLRSMVKDAEQSGQAVWAEQNDQRVTRIGRWLRRTRLDEVPQLFNVLRGEMSIIGPRPERPEFVDQLEQEIPFYRARLTVKPGLTGWAQVNYDYGRNVVDALEKLRYDLYYIKHQSIHLDIIILLKTVNTVLMLKGT